MKICVNMSILFSLLLLAINTTFTYAIEFSGNDSDTTTLSTTFASNDSAFMRLTTESNVAAPTTIITLSNDDYNELNISTAAVDAAAISATTPATDTSTVSILTPNEFDLFSKSINLLKDTQCKRDLNTTLWSILAHHHWAIAMYDATVKSAVGLEYGVLHQFGHFDQCLDQQKFIVVSKSGNQVREIPVRAKYCLTNVTLNGLTVHNTASRNKQTLNYTIAYWGACVPATCSASDVEIFLQHLLQRPVVVDEHMCQLRANALHIDDGMLIYAIIIFFFCFLAILSTTYHVYLIYNKSRNDGLSKIALRSNTLNIALLSFSIIENTKKMAQASKDQLGLNSINGIKALAMIFILCGHAISFIYGGPLYNADFFSENIRTPTFAFLSNSLLFVDVFLLLSGFLFCRILLIELERRRGKINVMILYIGRYIRLTPAYLAIIGFYMTWFPNVGSGGPLWQQRIVREQERCKSSWWLNVLYINNYINTEKFCMFQSWYLSVDSQLFFLAPIVIYLLYKSRKYGLRLLIALAIVTTTIPFIVTYMRKLDPTLLVYSDEVTDLNSNVFYIGLYIKTHMRASAYVIGLLTAFLVHLIQEKRTKLPTALVRLAWFLAVIIGAASMFAVCRFYVKPFNLLESTLYAGFHKLGWNLSVAWLVLAATTGHAGWLQNVLSSRVFVPISRLTYCAYLSNGIVELYHSSIVREARYAGYISTTNEVLSHALDTFVLAFFLCLLFESPIHALERILLRNNNAARKDHNKASNAKQSSDSQTPSTSEEQVA